MMTQLGLGLILLFFVTLPLWHEASNLAMSVERFVLAGIIVYVVATFARASRKAFSSVLLAPQHGPAGTINSDKSWIMRNTRFLSTMRGQITSHSGDLPSPRHQPTDEHIPQCAEPTEENFEAMVKAAIRETAQYCSSMERLGNMGHYSELLSDYMFTGVSRTNLMVQDGDTRRDEVFGWICDEQERLDELGVVLLNAPGDSITNELVLSIALKKFTAEDLYQWLLDEYRACVSYEHENPDEDIAGRRLVVRLMMLFAFGLKILWEQGYDSSRGRKALAWGHLAANYLDTASTAPFLDNLPEDLECSPEETSEAATSG